MSRVVRTVFIFGQLNAKETYCSNVRTRDSRQSNESNEISVQRKRSCTVVFPRVYIYIYTYIYIYLTILLVLSSFVLVARVPFLRSLRYRVIISLLHALTAVRVLPYPYLSKYLCTYLSNYLP